MQYLPFVPKAADTRWDLRLFAHTISACTAPLVAHDNYLRNFPHPALYTPHAVSQIRRECTCVASERIYLPKVLVHTLLSSGCNNPDDYNGNKLLSHRHKQEVVQHWLRDFADHSARSALSNRCRPVSNS